MQKSFKKLNDVGIMVNYTVLAMANEDDGKYVIYTNYIPSDNKLGVKLFVGKVINDNPLEVDKASKTRETAIINDFIEEMMITGQKIRRVKDK